MKKSFKILSGVFLLLFLFSPLIVLADGMIVAFDPYSNRWDYVDEMDQQALIHYENGYEKMILSVGLKNINNQQTFWLLPLPTEPNRVGSVDVLEVIPTLSGEEISQMTKSELAGLRVSLQMTQIYTLPFLFIMGGLSSTTGDQETTKSNMGNNYDKSDITVYQHLEKGGLITELVTAERPESLYEYLKNKGLNINQESIPILKNYLGKNYSFIVSWINPTTLKSGEQEGVTGEASNVIQRGIFVTFPTNKIYYPLLPTNIYNDKIIPTTIRILGHVTPQIFNEIKNYSSTDYYFSKYSSGQEDIRNKEFSNFFEYKGGDIKYTKITINAPSQNLIDDLWIENKAPTKVIYQTIIAKLTNNRMFYFLLLLFVSILSALAASWMVFKGQINKNIFIKFSLVGAANFFWLIGVIVAIALIKTKEDVEEIKTILNELKNKGYFWKRRLSLILFLFFIPTIFILTALYANFEWQIRSAFLRNTINLIRSFLPFVMLFLAIIFSRIKKEDKELFNQLIKNKYNKWLILPYDYRKSRFVIYFSIVFMFLSWIVVKIIQLTV